MIIRPILPSKLNPASCWFLIALIFGTVSCKKSIDGEEGNNVPPGPATLTARTYSLPHSNAYYEYLPEGYSTETAKKYPLLLYFHGAGETGNGSSDMNKLLFHGPLKLVQNKTFPKAFTVKGNEHRFIVLSLQFTIYGIYPAEIDTFIEYAKKQYRVDESRVYLTGMSMGGAACWNYAGSSRTNAQKIAAMVPVAAYIDEIPADHRIDRGKAEVIAAANLPIWSTHNSGDQTSRLTWVNNAYDLLLHSNPPVNPAPKLTVFNAPSHEGWTRTYSLDFKEDNMNVYEWMLQYHR